MKRFLLCALLSALAGQLVAGQPAADPALSERVNADRGDVQVEGTYEVYAVRFADVAYSVGSLVAARIALA